MGIVNLEELMIDNALIGEARNDPVERSIARQLIRLKHQNKRLKDHIEKTGAWAHLKEIRLWKPFDFYHYFCTKFREKYRREYYQIGNIVRAYQHIEAFRSENEISKKEYKQFIDRAFERYFTNITVPTIAHICTPALYEYLMHETVQFSTPAEYHSLDRQLKAENDKFEEYVRQTNE
jgi:hypothetical protein